MIESMLMRFPSSWHKFSYRLEMRLFICICFAFVSSCFVAQDVSEMLMVDFGIIHKGDDRIKEVTVRSPSQELEQIVRIGANENEFDIHISSKEVSNTKQVTFRIKYNPRTKGVKSYDIPVYLSKSDPLNLKIKADVRYLEWEDYTPCPSFSSEPKNTDFIVTFKVVNSKDGRPIRNAEVAIAEQGVQQALWKTNRQGIIEKRVPLGYYAMLARAETFHKARKEGYINRRNNYFIFALDPDTPPINEKTQSEQSLDVSERTILIQEAPEVLQESSIDEVKELEPQDSFSISDFAPNNVVFLIDVSTSMNREDRLVVLKEAMIELLYLLRPEDKLSIITYSSSTNVILNSTHVNDKEELARKIREIEGKGLTAGETGIKKAYAIAKKNFIDGGNNQVYLATDGAFNKGETDVSKFVRRQRKQNIYMSIIAVKSPKWTVPKMEKIAKDANGDYVSISNVQEDKERLNILIKKQSKRISQ